MSSFEGNTNHTRTSEPVAPATLSKAARKRLAKAQAQAADTIAPTVNAVTQKAVDVSEQMPKAGNVEEQISETTKESINKVKRVASGVANGVSKAIPNVEQISHSAGQQVNKQVPNEQVPNGIRQATESDNHHVRDAVDTAKSVASGAIDDGQQLTHRSLSSVQDLAREGSNQAQQVASQALADGRQTAQAAVAGSKAYANSLAKNGLDVAQGVVKNAEDKVDQTVRAAIETAKTSTRQISSIAGGSLENIPKVSPPSSAFKPILPDTLPEPKGNSLPANRKRKTPLDFLPSGSGGTLSTSKNGVKFEDGVVPGQGQDGEKIMTLPVKKDRNMIERTTWTFIMIGGFIGK